jgi:hypothetical protein
VQDTDAKFISFQGQVEGDSNRGAPMTVAFTRKNQESVRYPATVGEDGLFEVRCKLEPGTYSVEAITPNGTPSNQINLRWGQKMHVEVRDEVGELFKSLGVQNDNEVDAAVLRPGLKAILAIDAPADTGEIQISIVHNGASSKLQPLQVREGKAQATVDLNVTNIFDPVELSVDVNWSPGRGGKISSDEKMLLKGIPPLSAFKLSEGFRQERSTAPNYTYSKQPLFEASHGTQPPGELSTNQPLLRILGQRGYEFVQKIDVLVEAKQPEIVKDLGKAGMDASEKFTLAVETDGTFDSDTDSKKPNGKPVMLFPGKNVLTVFTSLNDKRVVLEKMSVTSVPPTDAELWAWLYWTESDADVDLHVKPVMSGKTASKSDIYWGNTVKGTPAGEMVCWGTWSGTPEVFVVTRKAPEISGYEFYAKPDPIPTRKREPLKPAKLFFVLWTRAAKKYITKSDVMNFDKFPYESSTRTLMNQPLP